MQWRIFRIKTARTPRGFKVNISPASYHFLRDACNYCLGKGTVAGVGEGGVLVRLPRVSFGLCVLWVLHPHIWYSKFPGNSLSDDGSLNRKREQELREIVCQRVSALLRRGTGIGGSMHDSRHPLPMNKIPGHRTICWICCVYVFVGLDYFSLGCSTICYFDISFSCLNLSTGTARNAREV